MPDFWTYRIRPFKAWHHLRKLIQNKEDTEQVFHIIKALNGLSIFRDFRRYKASQAGQARLREKRALAPILDNHARWLKLPQNTLGQAYVNFMTCEGLSAQGLIEEYDKFNSDDELAAIDEDLLWYAHRRRDTHDLLHVLTGYGRDALGEACVLAFTHGQNRSLGIIFIAYMATFSIRKILPQRAPVIRAVREGFKLGNQSTDLLNVDIAALMQMPLDEARQSLGIDHPKLYRKIHNMCHAHNIDPYVALT